MSQKPIAVDMLILEYHPIVGGAQRQIKMLAPLLTERGVRIRVLTRHYPGLASYEEIEGVPVHRLPAPGPKATAAPLYTAAALWKIWQQKPDLLHAYSFFSPLSTAVAAKQLFGLPVVDKVLRGGQLGDVVRMQNKRFGARRLASYRQHVDAFVTISQEIDRELDSIGVPPAKRPFIPNGVDVARFAPLSPPEKEALRHKLGLPAGEIVVFTGRLSPEKRVEQLVQVWPAVRQQYPSATLLLLGTGPLETSLKAQAGAGVLFGGRVDNVADYLQAADLFVLPSATEGLSNSLLEALSAGLPAIATRVGGAEDVIEHGRSGWLIPPDEPQALQAALLKLLSDAALREAHGRVARQNMVQNFSLDTIADKLRHLYDTVLQNQTQPLKI